MAKKPMEILVPEPAPQFASLKEARGVFSEAEICEMVNRYCLWRESQKKARRNTYQRQRQLIEAGKLALALDKVTAYDPEVEDPSLVGEATLTTTAIPLPPDPTKGEDEGAIEDEWSS